MLQDNIEVKLITDCDDARKYTVGTILTFRSYDPREVAALDEDHVYVFQRGDRVRVDDANGCGMGIDVVRLSDGQCDMVWPNEVIVSRYQETL